MFEKPVEIQQTEPRVVHAIGDVLAVEDFQRNTAIPQCYRASESEHLELARHAHLYEVGPLLLDKFDADPDRIHTPFPQLIKLAAFAVRR